MHVQQIKIVKAIKVMVPAVLNLNMMDVAKGHGITIDTGLLEDKLGIPVVPMSAIQKKIIADFMRP